VFPKFGVKKPAGLFSRALEDTSGQGPVIALVAWLQARPHFLEEVATDIALNEK
jgi:hypothetical protein